MAHLTDTELFELVNGLTPTGMRMFIACSAARQLAGYRLYAEATGEGGLDVLVAGLDFVWTHTEDDDADAQEQIAACDALMDNETEAWEEHRNWAENSIAATIAALRSFEESGPDIAVETARYGLDTIDLKLVGDLGLDMNDDANERVVENHPVMLREHERLRRDAREIRGNVTPMAELRRRAEAESTDFLP